MKKFMLVTLIAVIACISFTACGKSDSSADDAYYTYIAQDITEDTITLKGYNGGTYDNTFDIDVEKWNMTQFEAGTYIKIIVNQKDEILGIEEIDKSDITGDILEILEKDNNIKDENTEKKIIEDKNIEDKNI